MTTEHPFANDLDFMLETLADPEASVYDEAGCVYTMSQNLSDPIVPDGSEIFFALAAMGTPFWENDGEIDISDDNEWDVPSTSDDVLFYRPDFYDFRDRELFGLFKTVVRFVWGIDDHENLGFGEYVQMVSNTIENIRMKAVLIDQIGETDKPITKRRVM